MILITDSRESRMKKMELQNVIHKQRISKRNIFLILLKIGVLSQEQQGNDLKLISISNNNHFYLF